jgi:hypothetical protein
LSTSLLLAWKKERQAERFSHARGHDGLMLCALCLSSLSAFNNNVHAVGLAGVVIIIVVWEHKA